MSFSTELACPRHIHFTPDSDRTADIAGGPFRAMNGLSGSLKPLVDFVSQEPEVDRFGRPLLLTQSACQLARAKPIAAATSMSSRTVQTGDRRAQRAPLPTLTGNPVNPLTIR